MQYEPPCFRAERPEPEQSRASANRTSTATKYWQMWSAAGTGHPGCNRAPAFAGMTGQLNTHKVVAAVKQAAATGREIDIA
jgi:hypothetical protein